MTARTAIFARIRHANGPDAQALDIEARAAALVANPESIRAGFQDQSNLERFIEKATSERVTATIDQIPDMAAVPSAIAGYLKGAGLAQSIALQPREQLTALDWSSIETHNTPTPNEPVAVSIADLAVAESGSVVFRSAPDAPVLMSFLPLHHIVIVPTHLIRRHLEDVFDHFGSGPENQPRNLNIVTGTSGTADIEAKNIRGAHGPRYMHLVLVG
ncbi:MAG: LutC/YkgG family protein [Pikeienuella sp.]